ncbi:hypothetical protein M2322_004106 [Rhodoblastus acidophilus]|nr:hypothetical protein [Rhodoblastus acidophilus]
MDPSDGGAAQGYALSARAAGIYALGAVAVARLRWIC